MIHDATTMTPSSFAQPVSADAVPSSMQATPEDVAHTFHVVYCTGSKQGGMWEVQVVAADVADAERGARYFAAYRHEAEIHVIAIVCTETLK